MNSKSQLQDVISGMISKGPKSFSKMPKFSTKLKFKKGKMPKAPVNKY